MTDEAKVANEPLVAGLTRHQLHEIHSYLCLTRAAEERLEVLFRQGHVHGGLYRSLGQEGEAVVTAYALRRRTDGTGDVLSPLTRDLGALFVMGATPEEYYRQYLARRTSPTRGRETNLHFTDFERGFVGPVSPLGTMVEVMAGITLSFRMAGEDRVGMVYIGDGGSSTGAFHEGVNLAGVQRCPLVVVVEANQYAFSTPTWKQTRVEHFVDKAPGYGIAGERVDGNDVLATYEAAVRAVERARAGEGTTLLEVETYRRRGHAQHDSQEYVGRSEIERWEVLDPIARYRQQLLDEGWALEEELVEIETGAEERVRRAADTVVDEALPDGESALGDVYTDVPIPRPWPRPGAPAPGRS